MNVPFDPTIDRTDLDCRPEGCVWLVPRPGEGRRCFAERRPSTGRAYFNSVFDAGTQISSGLPTRKLRLSELILRHHVPGPDRGSRDLVTDEMFALVVDPEVPRLRN